MADDYDPYRDPNSDLYDPYRDPDSGMYDPYLDPNAVDDMLDPAANGGSSSEECDFERDGDGTCTKLCVVLGPTGNIEIHVTFGEECPEGSPNA